ncbi:plasmid mobilization relaxosome protein MobC [Streptomyces sp. CA-146814]|uniref:plasmid mobilization relaxosome protein MobC n=1 Tax=Streptomyces sp. CA-146814 TaxID=3240053 RepID=UPI003D8EB12D
MGKATARRRSRDKETAAEGRPARRDRRVNLAYNEDEFRNIEEAGSREGLVPAAWAAKAALAVANEVLVPTPTASAEVVAELIEARHQLSRVGNNANQIAKALNSDGSVTEAQLAAVLAGVEKAVRRVDEATLQLMRERRAR